MGFAIALLTKVAARIEDSHLRLNDEHAAFAKLHAGKPFVLWTALRAYACGIPLGTKALSSPHVRACAPKEQSVARALTRPSRARIEDSHLRLTTI